MKFYVHKDFVTSFSFLVSYCRCSSTSSLGVVLAPRSFLESFSILPSSFQFLYPTPVFPPAGVFLDPSPSFLNHPSIFGWFFVSLSPFFLRLSSLSFFFFAFVASFSFLAFAFFPLCLIFLFPPSFLCRIILFRAVFQAHLLAATDLWPFLMWLSQKCNSSIMP